jgi:hypothetical protein
VSDQEPEGELTCEPDTYGSGVVREIPFFDKGSDEDHGPAEDEGPDENEEVEYEDNQRVDGRTLPLSNGHDSRMHIHESTAIEDSPYFHSMDAASIKQAEFIQYGHDLGTSILHLSILF